MTIISSQHHIDSDLVEAKISELRETGVKTVEIPCWYIGNFEGIEYAVQSDKHHTLAAARELGLKVVFAVDDDPENFASPEEALEAHWNDGDWYNVETSNPYYEQYDLTF